MDLFKAAYQEALRGVHLTQGRINEVRTIVPCFDDALPTDAGRRIYAWFRDEWSTTEAEVRGDARNAGPTSPAILVFLPAQNRNELRSALIEHRAAQLTLERRGVPVGPEGQDARSAMETRRNDADRRIQGLVKTIFEQVQVYQGGGQRVDGQNLTEKLQAAGKASVVRLYGDFDVADQEGWDRVVERARKGETQPLKAIGYQGDTERHPVCAIVLKQLGAGRDGAEIKDDFDAPPHGWPRDVVDGALYALLAGGHVLATDKLGRPVDARGLERRQISQCHFKPETVTITPVQKIQIRKVFQEAGIGCQPDQETEKAPELQRCLRSLAQKAGGDPPFPTRPDQKPLEELEALTGNALLAELYSRRDALIASIQDWRDLSERIIDRAPAWSLLGDLLDHAKDLGPYQKLADEAQAIADQRALLAAHDPVQALLDKTVDLLRNSLNHNLEEYRDTLAREQAALEQDTDWQRLDEAQRQRILAERHLGESVSVETASPETILGELDRCSLSQWAGRTQALRGRFEGARMDAAKLLQPTVTHVDLPRRTLTSEEDLTAWLAEAEQRIRDKLKTGPVRI